METWNIILVINSAVTTGLAGISVSSQVSQLVLCLEIKHRFYNCQLPHVCHAIIAEVMIGCCNVDILCSVRNNNEDWSREGSRPIKIQIIIYCVAEAPATATDSCCIYITGPGVSRHDNNTLEFVLIKFPQSQ